LGKYFLVWSPYEKSNHRFFKYQHCFGAVRHNRIFKVGKQFKVIFVIAAYCRTIVFKSTYFLLRASEKQKRKEPMSKRRFYFHLVMILAALVIGALSFWHTGFWMEGKNKIPNFTLIAMVLLVISQIAGIKAYQSQRKNDENRS
jgi:cytochrome bd-type quinol oxidase subunit 2